MRVLDAFPYALNPEVLAIRLATLADVVDKFVIVEADRTFAGAEREAALPALLAHPHIAPYADRITPVWLRTPDGITDPWRREEWLRDAVLEEALRVTDRPDDMILFGDHDEIPRPVEVAAASRRNAPTKFSTRYHEWFLDLAACGSPGYIWEFRQPIMVPVRAAWLHPGQRIRAAGWAPFRRTAAGWHFTLQGGIDEVYAKLRATAHTELQTITRDEVLERMAAHKDLLDRAPMEVVPLCDLPPVIAEREDYYREMGMLA